MKDVLRASRNAALPFALRRAQSELGEYAAGSAGSSRHGHMRELRIQYRGEPYRVLYAFDPRRVAVLLIGGSKGGDDRWYDRLVPVADDLYDEHLAELREEGLINGA